MFKNNSGTLTQINMEYKLITILLKPSFKLSRVDAYKKPFDIVKCF